MPTQDPPYFTRDPHLAAGIADEFGGGAPLAEALQAANDARFPEELVAAQLLPGELGRPADKRTPGLWETDKDGNETLIITRKDVASAADLSDDELIAFDAHGKDHVIYSFHTPDGRVGKDALLLRDGKLSLPEREETPQRASLRAHAEANRTVRDAKSKAEDIIADARAKAEELIQKAAAKAEEQAGKESEQAAKAEAKGSSGSRSTRSRGGKS